MNCSRIKRADVQRKPKGTIDGYPFRLFAMISDFNDDKVAKFI